MAASVDRYKPLEVFKMFRLLPVRPTMLDRIEGGATGACTGGRADGWTVGRLSGRTARSDAAAIVLALTRSVYTGGGITTPEYTTLFLKGTSLHRGDASTRTWRNLWGKAVSTRAWGEEGAITICFCRYLAT